MNIPAFSEINKRILVFVGIYRMTRVKIRFRGYLFLRMGRILVLFIYFAHVSFWTIFREAPVSVQYRGFLFSRMAGNFAKL